MAFIWLADNTIQAPDKDIFLSDDPRLCTVLVTMT